MTRFRASVCKGSRMYLQATSNFSERRRWGLRALQKHLELVLELLVFLFDLALSTLLIPLYQMLILLGKMVFKYI